MTVALTNGRVLTADGLQDGCTVLIANGKIQDISRQRPTSVTQTFDLRGHLLLPGFVDLQVNGGGGTLFGADPTPESLQVIGDAHRRFGTTSFLPTLVSVDLPRIEKAIAAVTTAIAAGGTNVAGVHIEGPFISRQRKGIHDETRFRRLDDSALKLLASAKRGKTLVTLAPEETTPETIRRLAGSGVIVAAGHTNASYDEIRVALAHGLAGFTHVFNAMSPLTSRAPGTVGAALEDRASWCGIIADGQHVHPATLRLALRCKGPERLALVTDSMPGVGTNDTSFMLDGQEVLIRDGVCYGRDGTLAGSNLDMASTVRNAMSMMQASLSDAVRMASATPAEFLGLGGEIGRIAPGYRANLVWATETVGVLGTWLDGNFSEH